MLERVFYSFLRFYPSAFRCEYGAAMAETFSARLGDRSSGSVRCLLFLLRECASAAVRGAGLRIAYAFELSGRGSRRNRAGTFSSGRFVRGRRPLVGRGRDVLPDITRGFRHAARVLMRSPAIAVSGILTLGLGIGLATTIFSFIYAAVYRPLPVPEGDRIVHLEQNDAASGRTNLRVAYHDFLDWKTQQTAFEDIAAYYTETVNLSGEERPERYSGGYVTTNAFSVLEVSPMIGRVFLPEESQPGSAPVAVIGHSTWLTRYGGDADIVGRTVGINGVPTNIVGVMPEGFAFPYSEDVWLPLQIDPLETERGGGPGLDVFARLREDVTLEAARAEFERISARLAASYPATNQNIVAFIEPYINSYRGSEAEMGATFFLGFGLAVLLIACFNVANLLLAQAVAQTKEQAVRVALGASRFRVVAGVLQHSLLLAFAGAVLGTALAATGSTFLERWITAIATSPGPYWTELKVDAPVLLFVLVAAGISALASGLLPALRASRTDVHGTLTDTTWGNSSLRIGRVSRLLVLCQISVTALLLILAGHLGLQVSQARSANYGYPTADVLTAQVALSEGAFPTREDRLDFHRELIDRVEDLPGVVAAASSTAMPGTRAGIRRAAIMGHDYPETTDIPPVRVASVSPGFFDAFQAQVFQGRTFTKSDDDAGLAVAMVNQPFVERFLSGEAPVGKQIRLGWPEPQGAWRTIIGVVQDLNMDGAMEPAGNPQGVYIPIAQTDAAVVSVAVRTNGPPLSFAPTLRDEVMDLQGDTPIYFVRTLQDSINNSLVDLILVGSLLWVLALAAFFLASVGLYGVTSFLTDQRTRELGIRLALGAKAGNVLRLVVRQGARQVMLGLSLGILLAAGTMKVMAVGGLELPPWNTLLTSSVCLVLAGTGLLAVFVPAMRVTKVDPVNALRNE